MILWLTRAAEENLILQLVGGGFYPNQALHKSGIEPRSPIQLPTFTHQGQTLTYPSQVYKCQYVFSKAVWKVIFPNRGLVEIGGAGASGRGKMLL